MTRILLLVTVVTLPALFYPAVTVAQHQSCYRCSTGAPPGAGYCTTSGGEGGTGHIFCVVDSFGCHETGPECILNTVTSVEDTAASSEVTQMTITRATLRRAASGRLFLRFSSGAVGLVHQSDKGTLVLTKCDGGEIALADYLSEAQGLSVGQ